MNKQVIINLNQTGINLITIDESSTINLTLTQRQLLINQLFSWLFHQQAIAYNLQNKKQIEQRAEEKRSLYYNLAPEIKNNQNIRKRYKSFLTNRNKLFKSKILAVDNTTFIKQYHQVNFLNQYSFNQLKNTQLGKTYQAYLIDNLRNIAKQQLLSLDLLNDDMDWLSVNPYQDHQTIFTLTRINNILKSYNSSSDQPTVIYLADLQLIIKHSVNSVGNFFSLNKEFSNLYQQVVKAQQFILACCPYSKFIVYDHENNSYYIDLNNNNKYPPFLSSLRDTIQSTWLCKIDPATKDYTPEYAKTQNCYLITITNLNNSQHISHLIYDKYHEYFYLVKKSISIS